MWGKHDAKALLGVDVVLGADLLFFEDFHPSLLDLLSSVLRPDGGTESRGCADRRCITFRLLHLAVLLTGVACLLQPSRGGALERFVARARAAGGQEAEWEVVEEAIGPLTGDGVWEQQEHQQQKEEEKEDRLRLLKLQLVGRSRGA